MESSKTVKGTIKALRSSTTPNTAAALGNSVDEVQKVTAVPVPQTPGMKGVVNKLQNVNLQHGATNSGGSSVNKGVAQLRKGVAQRKPETHLASYAAWPFPWDKEPVTCIPKSLGSPEAIEQVKRCSRLGKLFAWGKKPMLKQQDPIFMIMTRDPKGEIQHAVNQEAWVAYKKAYDEGGKHVKSTKITDEMRIPIAVENLVIQLKSKTPEQQDVLLRDMAWRNRCKNEENMAKPNEQKMHMAIAGNAIRRLEYMRHRSAPVASLHQGLSALNLLGSQRIRATLDLLYVNGDTAKAVLSVIAGAFEDLATMSSNETDKDDKVYQQHVNELAVQAAPYLHKIISKSLVPGGSETIISAAAASDPFAAWCIKDALVGLEAEQKPQQQPEATKSSLDKRSPSPAISISSISSTSSWSSSPSDVRTMEQAHGKRNRGGAKRPRVS